MKRIVKKYIYGGVYLDYETNTIKFNWGKDSTNDIMKLSEDVSGEFNKNRVRYIYGYEYVNNVSNDVKKLVRNNIKNLYSSNMLYTKDVEEFVENGVLRFDARCPLSDISVLVSIESTNPPSVVDVMGQYIFNHSDNLSSFTDFKLIKEMYSNVKVDKRRLYQSLSKIYDSRKVKREVEFILNKFEELKKSGELFQMKRIIPKEAREAFFDFLRFKTEDDRKLYESLQGVNVLIYDDFMTSGRTVDEIIRYLRSIHDKNTLTVFVLIKQ